MAYYPFQSNDWGNLYPVDGSGGNDTIEIDGFGELPGLWIYKIGNDLEIYFNSIVHINNQYIGTNNIETLTFVNATFHGYALGTYQLNQYNQGTSENDVLVADNPANPLVADGGNDLLFDGSGNDTLEGGFGNDLLRAGGGDDMLLGGADDDTYTLVSHGADTINDTSGNDRIVFDQTTFESLNFFKNASTGNLEFTAKPLWQSPYHLIVTDHYSGQAVESLSFYGDTWYLGYYLGDVTYKILHTIGSNTGTSANEIIAGSDGTLPIDGGAGNDLLFGNGGNDTITGGAGDDLISGGDGVDTANFTGSRSEYTVTYNAAGYFTVEDHVAGRDGTDTVISIGADKIETLHFADGDVAICFMAGTMIRTPDGAVAVETLKRGDLVMTSDGRAVPVTWLGRQTISTRFADPLRVLPIRIRAGALGECMPARDLLVSPDHALFVGGVLVQAGALVNGSSIIRETAVPQTFVYYHVEVDDHSLIFAEDVPAETFIDNVDRLAFDNWDEHQALYPDGKAIAELPYPRAKAHRQVPQALRAQLAGRGAALNVTENASAA
jgi:hypothetical protein